MIRLRDLKRKQRPEPPRPALQRGDFPAVQRAGGKASAQAQQWFTRWIKATLVLTVVAAVMGAVEHDWAGWVAAGAFTVSLVLGLAALRRDLEARWYDARALAESAKSVTWKYAVGSSEFPTGADVRDEFHTRVRSLLKVLPSVRPPDAADDFSAVERLRAEPLPVRTQAYLDGRVHEQRQWYADTAEFHAAWAWLWQAVAVLLQVAGLTGAVLKGLDVTDVDWLGIAAAGAAGTTAWLQTKDHVTLARAYTVTAHELSLAAGVAGSARGDEAAWWKYVDDTEAAISREHNLWLGRRRGTEHLDGSEQR